MPVELFLSPILRPVAQLQAYLMSFHRDSSHYTPRIVELDQSQAVNYAVRLEFGTGSKVFGVYDNSNPEVKKTYDEKIWWMKRSRAVKGSYKMYGPENDLPVGAIRAGFRSNVLLFKLADDSELELGWHVVSHKNDVLDNYRIFRLSDGNEYHWTTKGHFLERIYNAGAKEAEVRERVGQATIYPGKKGFDLTFNKDLNPEMVIATALICYIEAWNTYRGYGGIYGAAEHEPSVFWKRD